MVGNADIACGTYYERSWGIVMNVLSAVTLATVIGNVIAAMQSIQQVSV
jgi:type III secretory pathway component EscS